ncbi:PAS domain S-box-containing protein [Nannocystis exedens]|uniref:histidine kinase n=1 Tax=Nannocystis exedens TaxID=54 RepID=A0A1I2IXE8_9BACT|nr:PAS domain-containing sensor histidine kinase [Nannocystis exedens]PCC67168.1 two-component sensor histidine kinase [Nannocystis exedens]SFF46283.1 PAS domain S-box-containing protein [Nannocystis exedens]
MIDRDRPHDAADLRAELARLNALLVDTNEHHHRLRDALIVRSETLEGHVHALEALLDWYADLYEHAPIPYLALDGNGVVREVNLTGAALLGVERLRLIGRPLRLHVVLRDRRKFLDHMLRCRRAAGPVVTELDIEVAERRVVPVQLISRRSTVAGEAGTYFRTAVFDLTERRHAESALRLEHERLSLALTASGAGLYDYSWPAAELTPSERWWQLVGRPPGEPPQGAALWQWFQRQIVPADRATRDAAHARFVAGESNAFAAEFRLLRSDGATVWLRELSRAAETSAQGHARHVVGVLMDITAEKQRIEAAAQQTALLRDLSAALFRVEENERRELATLLHDVLGQQLVAARLQLGALKPTGRDADVVRDVLALLDDAQQEVRSVTFQLRPPILQDLGLVPGLRWLARETSNQFKLPIAVIAEDTLPRLAGDPEYLLFRCVRELLLNVVKHAEATAVRVEVGGDEEDILVIRVSDDGKGFDPARVAADRQVSRSFGLLSVRERILGLGGHVRIDSTPGCGTRVELHVPLAES